MTINHSVLGWAMAPPESARPISSARSASTRTMAQSAFLESFGDSLFSLLLGLRSSSAERLKQGHTP
eukprot:13065512-Alexandrium_andersonii.AAC.1